MAYVNFNRTKPASFALSEYADKNTIYFTIDTHEIIINGEVFGSSDMSGLDAERIEATLNNLTTLINQNVDNIS